MPTLGQVFHRAVDGTFAVDAQQRIIYWDPACEDLLGCSSKWVLGRRCCDVLQGRDPTTGAQFCQPECCVAQLSGGNGGPKSFSLHVNGHNGDDPLRLSVNIVLVPSVCKDTWHVTHLLHVEQQPDVLTSIRYALHRDTPAATSRCAGRYDNSQRHGTYLTTREKEVLQLLAEGLSGAAIAKRLEIQTSTARNHLQRIQHKLGVHSQIQAVAYAYRHKLV